MPLTTASQWVSMELLAVSWSEWSSKNHNFFLFLYSRFTRILAVVIIVVLDIAMANPN